MIIVLKVLSQILGGGEEGYNGLIFVSSTANLDNINNNDKWNYRVFQTKDLNYSDFNKITNYYVLYGKFDKYWEVPGKYSYSEFKQASGTDSVTVYVNTANLSPYPEHITYKTIDEYKTDAENGRDNEIIGIVKNGFEAIKLDETSNYATQHITDETTELTKKLVKDELTAFKKQVENNKGNEVKASDKLELIQQLVNECAKNLTYNGSGITVTKSDSGYTVDGSTSSEFTGSNGINYNIAYSDNKITITTGEPAQTLYTILTGTDDTSPKVIKNTIAQIKTSQINDIVQQYVNTAQTLTDNIENAVTIIDKAADYNNIAVAWENAAKYETDDDKKKQYYGYAGQAYSYFCNEINESHNKYDSTSGSYNIYKELLVNYYIKSAECYTKSNDTDNATDIYKEVAMNYISLGENYLTNNSKNYIEAARAYEKAGDIYGRIGESNNAYDNAIQNYVIARNYQRAGNVYEKLVNDESLRDYDKANYYIKAGDAYKAAGSDYKNKAQEAYKNAGEYYNKAAYDNSLSNLSKANYYMKAGDAYKSAGSNYKTQAEEAYNNAGNIYNSEAKSTTDKASKANYYRLAGDAYRAAGNKEAEAKTAYANSGECYKNVSGIHSIQADYYMKAGDVYKAAGSDYETQAKKAYEKAGEFYEKANDYYGLSNSSKADNYMKSGDAYRAAEYWDAEEAYNNAVNIYNREAESVQSNADKAYYYMKAGDAYKAVGNNAEAQTAYENAVQYCNDAANDTSSNSSKAEYYMEAGDAYKAVGKNAEAQTAYENAGKYYNDAADAESYNDWKANYYMKAGDAYKEAGKNAEAQTAYENALMCCFLDGSHERIQQCFTKIEELKSN